MALQGLKTRAAIQAGTRYEVQRRCKEIQAGTRYEVRRRCKEIQAGTRYEVRRRCKEIQGGTRYEVRRRCRECICSKNQFISSHPSKDASYEELSTARTQAKMRATKNCTVNCSHPSKDASYEELSTARIKQRCHESDNVCASLVTTCGFEL